MTNLTAVELVNIQPTEWRPTPPDERECLLLARQGQQDALLSLLESYRPLLRMIARRFFLPCGDVDDLLQEATIGFIKAIRDFQPDLGLPFRPFAELCAARQVITAVKTATRQKHLPLNTAISLNRPRYDDDAATLEEFIPDGEAESPEEMMVRLEEGAAVMAAVRDLLSPYERAVILHWLDGMSFQEIADACGTHLKSVDNALWRVKCKLRRHFTREAAEHAEKYRA